MYDAIEIGTTLSADSGGSMTLTHGLSKPFSDLGQVVSLISNSEPDEELAAATSLIDLGDTVQPQTASSELCSMKDQVSFDAHYQ